MKKFIVLIGIINLCLGLVFAEAQKQSFEEKHHDKNAIFLEYSETIKVNEDWSYRKEEHKKLEILKEEARSMGEIPIPYDKERDRIVEISAYTTTPDGKRHRYTKIHDMSEYASYPVYSNAMVKMITMPEVNIGSIIEYRVVIESKGFPIKNAFWEECCFAPSIPTKLLKKTTILPKKLNIQFKEFNLTHKPKITENHTTITYAWEIPDVYDDRKAEDYLPPPKVEDFSEVIEFSSIKNWSDVSNWYYALVQKNLKITPDIEGATQKAIMGKVALKDRVRAILEYIQDNFRYVSMSLGAYSLEPHPADQVFKNKYGDCKDLSLLCVAMLKVAGIESSVALFRDEFAISDPQHDLPIPTLFDHVVVLVKDEKGKSFYIDPLLKGYDIGEYSLYYQNAYTFIITSNGGRLDRFPVFDEKRNYTKAVRNITINANGSALFETENLWDLDSAIETKENMKMKDEEARKDFYQKLDNALASNGEMIERRIEGLDKRYGTITGYAKFKRNDAFPLDGDTMVIDIGAYEQNQSFAKKERENAIFYPYNSLDEEIAVYKIPPGFVVRHMPKDLSAEMGFLEMKRKYHRQEDSIAITETQRFKRSEFLKEKYSAMKQVSERLPGYTNQRIILKKEKSWKKKLSEIIAIIRE